MSRAASNLAVRKVWELYRMKDFYRQKVGGTGKLSWQRSRLVITVTFSYRHGRSLYLSDYLTSAHQVARLIGLRFYLWESPNCS